MDTPATRVLKYVEDYLIVMKKDVCIHFPEAAEEMLGMLMNSSGGLKFTYEWLNNNHIQFLDTNIHCSLDEHVYMLGISSEI